VSAGARLSPLRFEYLHVVDLDGAFAGKPINAMAVGSHAQGRTMRGSSAEVFAI